MNCLITVPRSEPSPFVAASMSAQSSSLMRTDRCCVPGRLGMPPSLAGVRTEFNVTPLRCTYTHDSVMYVHQQAIGVHSMATLSQCPDCGDCFSPGEAVCPNCGVELLDYDDEPSSDESEEGLAMAVTILNLEDIPEDLTPGSYCCRLDESSTLSDFRARLITPLRPHEPGDCLIQIVKQPDSPVSLEPEGERMAVEERQS